MPRLKPGSVCLLPPQVTDAHGGTTWQVWELSSLPPAPHSDWTPGTSKKPGRCRTSWRSSLQDRRWSCAGHPPAPVSLPKIKPCSPRRVGKGHQGLEWAGGGGLAGCTPAGRRGLRDTPPLPTEPSLSPQGQAILVAEFKRVIEASPPCLPVCVLPGVGCAAPTHHGPQALPPTSWSQSPTSSAGAPADLYQTHALRGAVSQEVGVGERAV